MILLIDNYDSFSYNLFQLVGELTNDMIKIVRNDEITCEEIAKMNPTHILISPGPGRPQDAGICEELIEEFSDKIPIFGVCLGHQAICEVYGATIDYAKSIMHGKTSLIEIDKNCKLFFELPPTITVGRYHSLIARRDTILKSLVITAETTDKEIMAVRHRDYDTYGVQFHPESILTPYGKKILLNFLERTRRKGVEQ
ncbi:MAG: aminodeoxychorismate/anthranilate synthase component II [Christensenellaceae bacterium]|jgi:anthranilate synthase component 2|nr:aminodeoxychorismate/anthranilate synthase component II [Christensenellaceae bacterium]